MTAPTTASLEVICQQAEDALEKLASTPMHMSLMDWNPICNALLAPIRELRNLKIVEMKDGE